MSSVSPAPAPPPSRASSAKGSVVRRKVALIVPCHNEAAALPHLKLAIDRLRWALVEQFDLAVLLIDDGSTDDTASAMNELFGQCDGATIHRHEVRRGIASAIATGIGHADAEIVASIDADCTYDPLILEPMLRLLTGDVDLVVASPYHPDGGVESVPAWRLHMSRGASRLYRVLMRNKLYTYTSCVRVAWRDSIVDLSVGNPGFVGIVELLWNLDRRGGRIVEHPAILKTRRVGQSKMRVAQATLAHLGLLARAASTRLFARPCRRKPRGRPSNGVAAGDCAPGSLDERVASPRPAKLFSNEP